MHSLALSETQFHRSAATSCAVQVCSVGHAVMPSVKVDRELLAFGTVVCHGRLAVSRARLARAASRRRLVGCIGSTNLPCRRRMNVLEPVCVVQLSERMRYRVPWQTPAGEAAHSRSGNTGRHCARWRSSKPWFNSNSALTRRSSGHATASRAWPSFHSGPRASRRCVPLT